MNKAVVLFLAVAAANLAGCVTPGGYARGPSPSEIVAADPSTDCFRRLSEDAFILKHLGEKTGVGRDSEPTLQMLADRTKPTQEEGKAISAYTAARQSCMKLGSAYRRENMPPQVVHALESSGQRVTALYARLYAGDITYGEFNTLRMESKTQMQGQLLEVDQQRAQAEAQQEERRRVAVGQAIQGMQQQQILNQQLLNQQIQNSRPALPTTTRCNRFGNQVNCTTY